jgi:hypothetical protein
MHKSNVTIHWSIIESKSAHFLAFIALAAFASCFFPLEGNAELIFQPLRTSRDAQWRTAGSSLFSGIARIFDGLAAFERNDSGAGSKYMRDAEGLLGDAARDYGELARELVHQLAQIDQEMVVAAQTKKSAAQCLLFIIVAPHQGRCLYYNWPK